MSKRKPVPATGEKTPAAVAAAETVAGASNTHTNDTSETTSSSTDAQATNTSASEHERSVEKTTAANGTGEDEEGDFSADVRFVEVRVLVDFDGHAANDVATVEAGEVEELILLGRADPDEHAVAYAKSLREQDR